MPMNNQFRHQSYPTHPVRQPSFHKLKAADGDDVEFSRLHTELRVRNVVVVHGTFMGDDPFGISESLNSIAAGAGILQKPLQALASKLREKSKPFTDSVTGDIGNYTTEFRDRFQQLVGDDPLIQLMQPTWSGQNHHLARADLAVLLLCLLADLQPEPDQRVLLWGHSHAGNGFALLSNLLANERSSVARFFEAAQQDQPHWQRAQQILEAAPSPHPWAQSVMIAAFGTPVRYGWDTNGYRELVHVLHHRNNEPADSITTKPLFLPHLPADVISAKWGDWVQAFAVAGTDVATPPTSEANARMTTVLEASLETQQDAALALPVPKRIRDVCERWKTGTRCHDDGSNLLVDYEPGGRTTSLGFPVEQSLFGHGVATTLDWLPTHLALVMEQLARTAQA